VYWAGNEDFMTPIMLKRSPAEIELTAYGSSSMIGHVNARRAFGIPRPKHVEELTEAILEWLDPHVDPPMTPEQHLEEELERELAEFVGREQARQAFYFSRPHDPAEFPADGDGGVIVVPAGTTLQVGPWRWIVGSQVDGAPLPSAPVVEGAREEPAAGGGGGEREA
jgi:hypothetical protein